MSTGWLDGCLRIVSAKVFGCYQPGGSSQVHILSCENEFYLHENEKSFPCQRLSTLSRIDTQARGNSEMVYYVLI